MALPFKHPDSGIYYIRRKVPDELRSALGREFKRSLKTRDSVEAMARFAAAWSESDHLFALARAQCGGAELLTAQDAQQLAARWVRAEQERLVRTGSYTDYLVEEGETTWQLGNVEETSKHYVTVQQSIEKGDDFDWPSVVRSLMERALRDNNLPLPPRGSASDERAMLAFREHLAVLSEWAMDRDEGRKVMPGVGLLPHAPIGREPPPLESRGDERSLRTLFDSYAQEKVLNDGDTRATRRTINAYRAIVEGFVDLHGDMGVREITRQVVAQYRGSLAKLPAKGKGIRGLKTQQLIDKADKEGLPRLSGPTIRNRLRAISAVLSCGVRLGWLHENPVIAGGTGRAAAKAATKRQAGTGRRKHYTQDELDAIFSSPVFAAGGWTPPRANFGKAWYWLPLLLYYTGARREELAQLAVSDVKNASEGGWHLSILATADDADGPRGVKNEGSRRLIPLHPALIELGFITYLKGLPVDGPLFPRLRPDPKGYFGANFGKRWGAYLRDTVKLASPASPVHGFRHTFKTLCREAGIPEDVHDAITGHAGNGGVARDYGEMPLTRMAAEMQKFPTLSAAPNKQEFVDPLVITDSERAALLACR